MTLLTTLAGMTVSSRSWVEIFSTPFSVPLTVAVMVMMPSVGKV